MISIYIPIKRTEKPPQQLIKIKLAQIVGPDDPELGVDLQEEEADQVEVPHVTHVLQDQGLQVAEPPQHLQPVPVQLTAAYVGLGQVLGSSSK